MKPVNEWTDIDVLALIVADTRESLTLDYKRSAALGRENSQRKELSKDVSAFANSAGGIIVYGMVEKNGKPDSLDEGCDDGVVSREFIEQIINSTIQPRVQGVLIRQIPRSEGRSIYVISIPQATSLAPHQAADNKYYRRFNFESVPMADYEIRDTMRRATTPELYVEYQFTDFQDTTDGLMTRMAVIIGNKSREPSFYSTVDIAIDQRATSRSVGENGWSQTSSSFAFDNGYMSVIEWHRKLMIPGTVPIFREKRFVIGTFELTINRDRDGYFIGQDISCPGFRSNSAGVLTSFSGKPTFSPLTDHSQLG